MRRKTADLHAIQGPHSLLARPTCYVCFRPTAYCVCGYIEPFAAHCRLLIIQHPNERMKYYSTAKLVVGAITNARLLLGVEFEANQIKRTVKGGNTFLLYPSASAQSCEDVVLDAESTVVVVDGTWEEAGKILFRNPELKEFPCLTFKQPLRSNYRIRKQPRDNYLSTIESIAQLLKLNAAAHGLMAESLLYDRLLSGFDRMVEEQLRHVPARS